MISILERIAAAALKGALKEGERAADQWLDAIEKAAPNPPAEQSPFVEVQTICSNCHAPFTDGNHRITNKGGKRVDLCMQCVT